MNVFQAFGVIINSLASMSVKFSAAGEEVAETLVDGVKLIHNEVDNLHAYQDLRMQENKEDLERRKQEFALKMSKLIEATPETTS